MSDVGALALARARAILNKASADGVGDFLQRVSDPDQEVRPSAGAWHIRLRFIFRNRDEKRILASPTKHGINEPVLLIEEDLDRVTGNLRLYNYDVVVPEWNDHYGYHFHGHGGPAYHHRQGYGVPKGNEDRREPADILGPVVLWDLVSQAFLIVAERTGAVVPEPDSTQAPEPPPPPSA